MSAPPLLEVAGLDVHYGSVQVLFGVDLVVDEGEIVALLGTNGAGKSTLLSAVAGLLRPSQGTVRLHGRDLTGMAAHRVAEQGIVLVPGGKGVFPTLSVAENLNLAGWLLQDDPDRLTERTETVLAHFPRLQERWRAAAGNLSGGEQQMLTLAQAFISQPTLMMIDELSLGLAPVIVEQLLDIVRAIHQAGTTVVLVEQSVNVAVTIARRAVFMEKGEVRFDGPTGELLDRPDILRAVFLGGAAEVASQASARPSGDRAEPASPLDSPVALEVADIVVRYGGVTAVSGVDLQVRSGEILGIIGPNGAGKTTLFDAISGFAPLSGGQVVLGGTDITGLGPAARAVAGLGRSFQDARLFPALTVAENLAIALERHIPVRDPVAAALSSPATKLSERWVKERVDELIDLMSLQAFSNKFVHELSTGTRRVVDLACSLAHSPTVLLLDEPSSGIAQRESEALRPLLRHIRDQTGAAMIVIEHDVALLSDVADTMVALELGQVIASGTPAAVVTDGRVVESYLGEAEEVIRRSGGAVGSPRPAARRRRRPLVAPGRGQTPPPVEGP